MWVTLGAVHDGNAQNFNGARSTRCGSIAALSLTKQIRELYEQPAPERAGQGR
jgi:hypothetical protein